MIKWVHTIVIHPAHLSQLSSEQHVIDYFPFNLNIFSEVLTNFQVFSDGKKVGVKPSCTLHQGRHCKGGQYILIIHHKGRLKNLPLKLATRIFKQRFFIRNKNATKANFASCLKTKLGIERIKIIPVIMKWNNFRK